MAISLASNALSTLEVLGERLGITTGSEPIDSQINAAINAASSLIERATNRTFARNTSQVDNVPGYATEHLIIGKPPIHSIASIKFQDDPLDDLSEITFDSEAGLIFRPFGWTWTVRARQQILTHLIPGTERSQYEVTYDGGFVLPKDDPTRADAKILPADLEEAALQLAEMLFLSRGRDPSIKSEKLMNWNVTLGNTNEQGMPPFIAGQIMSYRHAEAVVL